jgi:5-methylcytosine-specific restriction protein A
MPAGLSRSGHPILEVDHVNDLGRGGDDHPENMIALCPNCHAVKTRGMNASGLRIALKTIAARLHAEALARAVER